MSDATQPPSPRRVFIAEDEPEMRALLAQALARDGFQVTALADGLELIEAVKRVLSNPDTMADTLPDLVVSDVVMPHCTGLVALAALKRMKLTAPVVLITAFGDEATHDQARRLGAAAVLDKPIDLQELRRLAMSLVP